MWLWGFFVDILGYDLVGAFCRGLVVSQLLGGDSATTTAT
jgi:hypothetical protein